MGEGKDFGSQREQIEKIVRWLREDGYEPEEKTHLNKDSNYFAIVKASENKGFHDMFPKNPLDKVIIFEIISMDENYKKAYKALPALDQNRFFFDLKISLLEMDVIFTLERAAGEATRHQDTRAARLGWLLRLKYNTLKKFKRLLRQSIITYFPQS